MGHLINDSRAAMAQVAADCETCGTIWPDRQVEISQEKLLTIAKKKNVFATRYPLLYNISRVFMQLIIWTSNSPLVLTSRYEI